MYTSTYDEPRPTQSRRDDSGMKYCDRLTRPHGHRCLLQIYFVNGKSLGACPAKVAMSGQPVVPFVDLFNYPGDEVTLIRDS